MVDIGGNHGTAGGHLVAHELRSYVRLDTESLGIHVLTDSHILHLGSDHAAACESHLRDTASLLGAAGRIAMAETYGVK